MSNNSMAWVTCLVFGLLNVFVLNRPDSASAFFAAALVLNGVYKK